MRRRLKRQRMVIAGYAATAMSSRGVLRDKKMTCSNEGTVRKDDQSTTGRRALASEIADAVRRHLAGDDTAMADLVRLATRWLTYVCREYRLSTHTAEDVVQNTMLALILHMRSLRDPHSALAWLTVVARREAIREIRVEKRVEPVGDMAVLDSALEYDNPERVFEAKLLSGAIQRNLAKLPARRRDLLWLVFLTEISGYATIADTLDIPIGSIGPTRRRSLDRMRELLCADEEWCLGLSA